MRFINGVIILLTGLIIVNETLNICVCNSIADELEYVIHTENIRDVILTRLPSKCYTKSFNFENVSESIKSGLQNNSDAVLIGCKQLFKLGKQFDTNIKFVNCPIGYCLEVLIDETLINYFAGRGYYIITNYWLKNFDKIFGSWGFNKSVAAEFFKESTQKILLLDSGSTEINYKRINELSEYLGIPVEVLPITRNHIKCFLQKIIFEWQLKKEKRITNSSYAKLTKQSADYAMIFEFIVKLVELDNEVEIVEEIFEIVNMLCAPRDIYFIPVDEKSKGDVIHKGETDLCYNNADDFLNNFKFNESESAFFEIIHLNEKIGLLFVNTVYFPEHISHYKNLIKTLSFVFGLAIANSRKIALLKRNQEVIRKYSEDLAKSNMDKDKFFSIIAHDLKSPFQGFLGLTEMLSDDISDLTSEEISTLSFKMHQSALNLFKLLENLLAWARMQKGNFDFNAEEINLKKQADEYIEIIKDRANQKGISVYNLIPEELKAVADKKMIDSVFSNLISNSVKFSTRGGKIEVAAKESTGNMIEIAVADNGVGMNELIINKLFKLSEKVGRKGTEGEESTGLGLLLCKEFIEKNKGTIWVVSKVNEGTTFYFTLPKLTQ